MLRIAAFVPLAMLLIAVAASAQDASAASDDVEPSETVERPAAAPAGLNPFGLGGERYPIEGLPEGPPEDTAEPSDGAADDPAGSAATEPPKPVPLSQTPEMIEKVLAQLLKTYKEHLQSPDWIARSMAVVGLAMIDDPRSTNVLVGVMEDDAYPIVRLYAWEALHARQSRLEPDQRGLWKKRCYQFASLDFLRGDMRLGLVGLIGEDGPTRENKRRLLQIFASTNSINPSDIRTLWALGDTIKLWQSGDMVLWLIERMKTLDDAYRAELVLRRLDETSIPYHTTLRKKSSQVMWATTHQRWMAWYRERTFDELAPEQCPRYEGHGAIMPTGEKILDTADPKWRRGLELRRFHLDQLDIGLALDTTASMRRPLEWIKRDVAKMMRAFSHISREPRIGITLYRDHGDAYVVRNLPFTANPEDIRKGLAKENPKGGGDIPEAVLEALAALVRGQKWSPGRRAKRVVVVMTDAPPKEETLDRLEEFVRAYAGEGFSFHAIKVRIHQWYQRKLKLPNYDKQLTTLDRLAEWGGGSSTWVDFRAQEDRHPRWIATAQPTQGNLAERIIMRQVLQAALDMDYGDRVDPFIGVLLEFCEEPVPETRQPFPEWRPGPPPVVRDPQMNR